MVGWFLQFCKLVLVARIGIIGISVFAINKWVLVVTSRCLHFCKLVLAKGMGVPHKLEPVNVNIG